MANTSHNTLTGVDLHFSKIQVTSGTPLVTPSYIGQSTWDSSNKIFYVSKGTATANDWQSDVTFSVQSGTTYSVISTDNESTIALSNVAARTIILPTTPINGFSVILLDSAGTAASANITVNTGGSDIFFTGNTSYILNSSFSAVRLQYSFSNSTWYVILVSLDIRYTSTTVVSLPPSTTPTFIGQTEWDTTTRSLYVAKGTSSSSDWQASSVPGFTIQSGTTYTVALSDNNSTIALTNTAARSITLPTTPINGFIVTLQDSAGTAYTANITITAGGSDVFNLGGSTLKLDSNFGSYSLQYLHSSGVWYVV